MRGQRIGQLSMRTLVAQYGGTRILKKITYLLSLVSLLALLSLFFISGNNVGGQTPSPGSGLYTTTISYRFTSSSLATYTYTENPKTTLTVTMLSNITSLHVETRSNATSIASVTLTQPAAPPNSTITVTGKSVLDGTLYLGFMIAFLLTVGSNYISIISEALGVRVEVLDYDECGRLYAKGTVLYSTLTIVLLIAAIISASIQPTVLILPFYFTIFGVPITITLTLLLAQLLFAETYSKSWDRWREEKKFHLFLGAVAAILGTSSLLTFNLVNSYMLAPPVPEALRVIVQTQELKWGDLLLLMVNSTWLPLTIKLGLIGISTSALVFSAVSVLTLRKTPTREALFGVRWGFKLALLFGLPIAIIGYWVAAILHTATPALALGLMGQQTQTGVAAALLTSVSPLWHLGVIGAVGVAGVTFAFYYSQASVLHPQWSSGIVDQQLTKIAAIILLLGLVATTEVSLLYQQQAIWTIYLMILGYFLIMSLWWYSGGRISLRIPILLAAAACLGILLLIGPYNDWYLASVWGFGFIPWPPVGFVAFTLFGYWLCKRNHAPYYIIPLACGLALPLGILAKLLDVALIKGTTIISIDPTVESVIKYWAQSQGVNITLAYQQYPNVSAWGTILVLTSAYILFLGILYLTARLNWLSQIHRSNEIDQPRQGL